MANITEIIGFSKVYNNNIHIPSEIIKKFKLKNGDKLVWALNDDKELIIIKANRINKESNYDFLQ